MDRNRGSITTTTICIAVALRKESVDRNRGSITTTTICIAVALRKESVDRNTRIETNRPVRHASLSARRAWIEIGRIRL